MKCLYINIITEKKIIIYVYLNNRQNLPIKQICKSEKYI